MFECLLFTCITISGLLESELQFQYDMVGENEFVGWVDGNNFSLDGVQTTNGKILQLNYESLRKGVTVHSHPKTFGSLWGFICLPSQKDFDSKKILGHDTAFLYCGGNQLIIY